MKKIALITSGFAPVPAVAGGAVEELTTILINENEKYNKYYFYIFTKYDKRLETYTYKNSDIIQIKISKFSLLFERIVNKVIRILKLKKSFTVYNCKLTRRVKKVKESFDAILYENLMDVIHKHSKSLMLSDKKVILHLHNDLNSTSKTIQMAQAFKNNKACVLSVSHYIQRSIETKVNYPEQLSHILYNCIDYNKVKHYENAHCDLLRIKLNLKEDDFVLLFIGRLNAEKGIYELADAFSRINNPKIKLVICGGTWGAEYKESRFTKQIYSKLDKQLKNTYFEGYITPDKLLEYYKLADVVVIPSITQESFGMVMLESALFGKPIIATRSGGMPEILSNKSVMYIDLDNNIIDNLCKQISYAYQNKDFCKALGESARKEILSRRIFEQKDYYANFAKIIDQFLESQK